MNEKKTSIEITDEISVARVKEVLVHLLLKKVFNDDILFTQHGKNFVHSFAELVRIKYNPKMGKDYLQTDTEEFIQEFCIPSQIPTKKEEIIAFMWFGASIRQTRAALKTAYRTVQSALYGEESVLAMPQLQNNIFVDLIFEWCEDTKKSSIWFKEY